MSVFGPLNRFFSAGAWTGGALVAALGLLSACSTSEDQFQAQPGSQIAPPSLTGPQLTVLAAYRSVCLGTSLDQQGAERALYVLGYKPAGEDAEKGLKRFSKGDARIVLSAEEHRVAAAPGPATQATTHAGPRRSSCSVSHPDLGSREAGVIFEQALLGSGSPYQRAPDGRAIIEGSDYGGVAGVLSNLGESGLELTKTARAPR